MLSSRISAAPQIVTNLLYWAHRLLKQSGCSISLIFFTQLIRFSRVCCYPHVTSIYLLIALNLLLIMLNIPPDIPSPCEVANYKWNKWRQIMLYISYNLRVALKKIQFPDKDNVASSIFFSWCCSWVFTMSNKNYISSRPSCSFFVAELVSVPLCVIRMDLLGSLLSEGFSSLECNLLIKLYRIWIER